MTCEVGLPIPNSPFAEPAKHWYIQRGRDPKLVERRRDRHRAADGGCTFPHRRGTRARAGLTSGAVRRLYIEPPPPFRPPSS